MPADPPPRLADLFSPEPEQWGLRGDPYLWQDMRDRFATQEIPATEEALYALVDRAFIELTGHSVAHEGDIFVEKYAQGGMSNGHVSPEFWRDIALPLLLKRLAASARRTTKPREPRTCPKCGSRSLVPIMRGEPPPEQRSLADAHRIAG